jgi:hypothetical protein
VQAPKRLRSCQACVPIFVISRSVQSNNNYSTGANTSVHWTSDQNILLEIRLKLADIQSAFYCWQKKAWSASDEKIVCHSSSCFISSVFCNWGQGDGEWVAFFQLEWWQ